MTSGQNVRKPWEDLEKMGIAPARSSAGLQAPVLVLKELCRLVPAWHRFLEAQAVGCIRLDGADIRWAVLLRDGSWLGVGAPVEAPAVSDEWAPLVWEIPAPIAAFYRVNNGFGPLGSRRGWPWRHGVLPVFDIRPLTARMRFGEENILYRPGDWWIVGVIDGGDCWVGGGGADALEFRRWSATSHELGPARGWDDVLADLCAHW